MNRLCIDENRVSWIRVSIQKNIKPTDSICPSSLYVLLDLLLFMQIFASKQAPNQWITDQTAVLVGPRQRAGFHLAGWSLPSRSVFLDADDTARTSSSLGSRFVTSSEQATCLIRSKSMRSICCSASCSSNRPAGSFVSRPPHDEPWPRPP